MFPTAVHGVLTDLQVDQDTINSIMNMLYRCADDLEKADVEPVAPAAFGASSLGSNLGYHTDLAHAKLYAAITNMMDNLVGVGERVGAAAADIVRTDEGVGTVFTTVIEGMDCISEGGFDSPYSPTRGDS